MAASAPLRNYTTLTDVTDDERNLNWQGTP